MKNQSFKGSIVCIYDTVEADRVFQQALKLGITVQYRLTDSAIVNLSSTAYIGRDCLLFAKSGDNKQLWKSMKFNIEKFQLYISGNYYTIREKKFTT